MCASLHTCLRARLSMCARVCLLVYMRICEYVCLRGCTRGNVCLCSPKDDFSTGGKFADDMHNDDWSCGVLFSA